MGYRYTKIKELELNDDEILTLKMLEMDLRPDVGSSYKNGEHERKHKLVEKLLAAVQDLK